MPLRRRFDLKFIVITTALSLSLMLIPGWQCSFPLDQGGHWQRENPWVNILHLTPSTVILSEGGTCPLVLDFTSDCYKSAGGFRYETGDPNWSEWLISTPPGPKVM